MHSEPQRALTVVDSMVILLSVVTFDVVERDSHITASLCEDAKASHSKPLKGNGPGLTRVKQPERGNNPIQKQID